MDQFVKWFFGNLILKSISQVFFSQIFSVIHFTAYVNLSNYFALAAKFTLLEIILHFDADYLSIAENEGIYAAARS